MDDTLLMGVGEGTPPGRGWRPRRWGQAVVFLDHLLEAGPVDEIHHQVVMPL